MKTHTVDLDVGAALAAPHTCPGCGAPQLHAVPAPNGVAFACPACIGTWRLELGVLVRADPGTDPRKHP